MGHVCCNDAKSAPATFFAVTRYLQLPQRPHTNSYHLRSVRFDPSKRDTLPQSQDNLSTPKPHDLCDHCDAVLQEVHHAKYIGVTISDDLEQSAACTTSTAFTRALKTHLFCSRPLGTAFRRFYAIPVPNTNALLLTYLPQMKYPCADV